MRDDMLQSEPFDNLEIVGYRHSTLNKTFLIFVLVALLGIVLGAFLAFAGGLAYKWIFGIAAAGCFPLLVVAMGSLNKALVALLIFSLSMQIDVSPWWSEKYATLQPGMPITLTGLLLLVLYTHWLFDPRRRHGSIRLFPWVTIPFGLLVLWSGLSFIVAPKPSHVLFKFPRALEAFFLFFCAANLLRSEEDIRFVIKCLAVTVTFTGVLGICQHFAGSSFNLQFLGGREFQLAQEYYALNISRVSGFLGHPNAVAWVLDGLLPALMICGIGVGRLRLRLLCLLSFILGSVTLVLTYSRGGWLAFIFSLVLIAAFLMTKQARKNYRGVLVRVVALSLVMMVLTLPFLPKIVTRLTKDDYGAAYCRIPLAKTGLKIVRHNWVTGVGLGNYVYVVEDYDPDPPKGDDVFTYHPVHTIYLHIAAELGVPALALFIWVSVAFFAGGIHALRTANKTTALFALGLMAGLAGLYLHGMVATVTLGHPRFIHLSFIGGLLVALGHLVMQNKVSAFMKKEKINYS